MKIYRNLDKIGGQLVQSLEKNGKFSDVCLS